MSFTPSRFLAVVAMLGASKLAIAGPKPFNGDAACDVLVAVAKAHYFVENIAGTYYCESIADFLGNRYYLINLKFNRDDDEREFVGSNLVGWYAVQKSTRAVFAVDIGEGKLGKRFPSSARPPKPDHIFRPTPSVSLN